LTGADGTPIERADTTVMAQARGVVMSAVTTSVAAAAAGDPRARAAAAATKAVVGAPVALDRGADDGFAVLVHSQTRTVSDARRRAFGHANVVKSLPPAAEVLDGAAGAGAAATAAPKTRAVHVTTATRGASGEPDGGPSAPSGCSPARTSVRSAARGAPPSVGAGGGRRRRRLCRRCCCCCGRCCGGSAAATAAKAAASAGRRDAPVEAGAPADVVAVGESGAATRVVAAVGGWRRPTGG